MKPAAPVTSVRIGATIPAGDVSRECIRYSRGDMNWVARTAVALIALQLVRRAVLAFGGYFYWDDLILVGRAGTQSLLSPAYLFDDHDGHVMPGAFLVAGGHHPAGAVGLVLARPSAWWCCSCWRRWHCCGRCT